MNIWNRLGDLAKGTRDWVGDIALGALSLTGAKFAWDVFTAPMNDDEQFNGFFNSIKNAGVNTVKILPALLVELLAQLLQLESLLYVSH